MLARNLTTAGWLKSTKRCTSPRKLVGSCPEATPSDQKIEFPVGFKNSNLFFFILKQKKKRARNWAQQVTQKDWNRTGYQ